MAKDDHKPNTRGQHVHSRQRAESAPDGFVTRQTLREMVDITESQLRSLIAREVVTADDRNSAGYAVYSLKTVDHLLNMKADGSLFRRGARSSMSGDATQYSADEGIRVFELLREGKTLEEIIVTAKVHPRVAQVIRADFDEIGGSIHLPRRVVEKINAMMALPGTFPLRNANGVLEVFELCGEARACVGCSAQPANVCRDCFNQARRSARRQAQEAVGVPSLISRNAVAAEPDASSDSDSADRNRTG